MTQDTNKQKPRIGITLGDPCGIGPEITAKALNDEHLQEMADFIIIGDKCVYDHYQKNSISDLTFHDFNTITNFTSPNNLTLEERGAAAYQYLQTGISLLKNGSIDSIVTAPVNKQAIIASGIKNFCGHTEMFAQAFNVKHVEMMFVGGPYKTIIATRHIPLKEITQALTSDSIFETIMLSHQCLKKTFKITNPKIAICGINPHAGEGGKIGTEDINIVTPAIEQAKQHHVTAAGPFAADTLFIPFNAEQYDLIIAMYHDQGLTPIKALYFTQLVNYTIGLPFIRTSTAHGTAENIVGQNKADPSSMRSAIELACELTERT